MKRRAFTLIEMVLSLGLLALVAAAVGGVVTIAGRANESPAQADSGTVATAAAVARVLDDLSLALTLDAVTTKSVTFTVADQTGDDADDTITYAWNGTADSTLTKSINSGTPVVVASRVKNFAIGMTSRQAYESSAGAPVEGPETLLASYIFSSTLTTQLNTLNGIAQYAKPVLDPAATGWRPTRVEFFIAQSGLATGLFTISAYQATSTTRSTLPLCTSLVLEASLPVSSAWQSFPLPVATTLDHCDGIFITLSNAVLAGSAKVTCASRAVPLRNCYSAITANAGVSWTETHSSAMNFRLYGRTTAPATSSTLVTRAVAVAVKLTLASDQHLGTAVFLAQPVAPSSPVIVNEGTVSSITDVFSATSSSGTSGGTDEL